MENSIELTLSRQEADVLVGILNQAVKNVGISDGGATAQNVLYFLKKINEAIQKQPIEQIISE